MKKIIFIVLAVVAATNIKAQTGTTDTTAYLHSVVANKARFIGQPFSRLMDSLSVEIRYFHPKRGVTYDVRKETSTRFGFYFPNAAGELYLTYPSLEIYWQPSLNATQSDVLWENANGGGWTSTVAAFYAPGIIADIKIRE